MWSLSPAHPVLLARCCRLSCVAAVLPTLYEHRIVLPHCQLVSCGNLESRETETPRTINEKNVESAGGPTLPRSRKASRHSHMHVCVHACVRLYSRRLNGCAGQRAWLRAHVVVRATDADVHVCSQGGGESYHGMWRCDQVVCVRVCGVYCGGIHADVRAQQQSDMFAWVHTQHLGVYRRSCMHTRSRMHQRVRSLMLTQLRICQPHGHGVFRWFDGDKYLGAWNDGVCGVLEGVGVQWCV